MREESRLRLNVRNGTKLYLDPTKGNKELGSELQKKYKKGVTTFMRDHVIFLKKLNNMKQLIVDYIPFEVSPEQINESMKSNNGKLIVRGVLQRR